MMNKNKEDITLVKYAKTTMAEGAIATKIKSSDQRRTRNKNITKSHRGQNREGNNDTKT